MTAQAQAQAWLAALPDLPAVDVTGTFDEFMARHMDALPAMAKAKLARQSAARSSRYRDTTGAKSTRSVPENAGRDKPPSGYRDSASRYRDSAPA